MDKPIRIPKYIFETKEITKIIPPNKTISFKAISIGVPFIYKNTMFLKLSKTMAQAVHPPQQSMKIRFKAKEEVELFTYLEFEGTNGTTAKFQKKLKQDNQNG